MVLPPTNHLKQTVQTVLLLLRFFKLLLPDRKKVVVSLLRIRTPTATLLRFPRPLLRSMKKFPTLLPLSRKFLFLSPPSPPTVSTALPRKSRSVPNSLLSFFRYLGSVCGFSSHIFSLCLAFLLSVLSWTRSAPSRRIILPALNVFQQHL